MKLLFSRLFALLLLLSIIGKDFLVLSVRDGLVITEKMLDLKEKKSEEDGKKGEDDSKSKKDENRFAAHILLPENFTLYRNAPFNDPDVAASLTYLATFTPPPESASC